MDLVLQISFFLVYYLIWEVGNNAFVEENGFDLDFDFIFAIACKLRIWSLSVIVTGAEMLQYLASSCCFKTLWSLFFSDLCK